MRPRGRNYSFHTGGRGCFAAACGRLGFQFMTDEGMERGCLLRQVWAKQRSLRSNRRSKSLSHQYFQLKRNCLMNGKLKNVLFLPGCPTGCLGTPGGLGSCLTNRGLTPPKLSSLAVTSKNPGPSGKNTGLSKNSVQLVWSMTVEFLGMHLVPRGDGPIGSGFERDTAKGPYHRSQHGIGGFSRAWEYTVTGSFVFCYR